jgi:hypothetical protein
VVWLVLAAGAVASTALLGASALRLESPVSFLLAAYLFASAEVIALTELLSLFGTVGAAGYAIGEAVLLVASAGAWHLRGRARPPIRRLGLRAAARAHPVVAVLALIVGCAVVFEGVLVFATPPNNWDSLSYHLSRAAGWYQRHGIEYFRSHTERENAFQPNGEMEILYTFVFAGRDTAAAATQFLAELAVLLGVYGCARRIGFGRPASLFGSLLTATLTEIALQSVTTQNDLLAASFVVTAAYLALGTTRLELALAGLAVGLALGTKATTAPGLALVALLTLLRPPRRARFAALAAASAIGFLAVGFYGYALNVIETGKPLGDPIAQGNTQPERITFGGTVSTAARIGFRFFDFSGFRVQEWVRSTVSSGGEHVFDALGIQANPPESTQSHFAFRTNLRANEDVSFFGPLGFMLVLPLALGFLVAGALRRAPPAQVVLAAAIPFFAVVLALGFRYNLWLGRFMVAPVALTMPLAAFVYRSRPVATAIALVGVLGLYYAHTKNEAKPVGVGPVPAVWSRSRAEVQTVMRPELLEVYRTIEQKVPPDAKLGTVLGGDDWDYPLYGPALGRRLVTMPRRGMLEFADRHGVRWIFSTGPLPGLRESRGWRRVHFEQDSRSTLLFRAVR